MPAQMVCLKSNWFKLVYWMGRNPTLIICGDTCRQITALCPLHTTTAGHKCTLQDAEWNTYGCSEGKKVFRPNIYHQLEVIVHTFGDHHHLRLHKVKQTMVHIDRPKPVAHLSLEKPLIPARYAIPLVAAVPLRRELWLDWKHTVIIHKRYPWHYLARVNIISPKDFSLCHWKLAPCVGNAGGDFSSSRKLPFEMDFKAAHKIRSTMSRAKFPVSLCQSGQGGSQKGLR